MQKIETDDNCLNLLRQGNSFALQYLIRIYFPVLCQYAEKITSNRAEAEDVTEEVFIKLWQRHAAFTSFNEVKGFLYTSTRNGSLNVLRGRQRQQLRHEAFAQTHKADGEPSIDEMVYEELLAEIRKTIALLPEKMRKIFILSYYKKMTNQEIADYLQLSQQTVRNQKTKALGLLKDLLKDKAFIMLMGLIH
jgi:RNA polymerase sigma-70 factor (family 1)